ncbi:hypothetical protein DPV78_004486 [Talaromyces pinophilus]|nr:hypothetical protein DPV78_004486 [Talaromyces pinophilus]
MMGSRDRDDSSKGEVVDMDDMSLMGFRGEYDLVDLIADEALEDSGNNTTYRFEKFGVDEIDMISEGKLVDLDMESVQDVDV